MSGSDERQTVLLQVGVKSIETGVWGAYQNVLINLKELKEDDVRQKVGFSITTSVCCVDCYDHR